MTRPSSPLRHFLSLMDLSTDELRRLIARAVRIKGAPGTGPADTGDLLRNRTAALVFEKSSTRTRVSFEAAMTQLGGSAMFLSSRDTQLGRGEPIEDSARVLSRMVDAVMIRTFDHERAAAFAACSEVPVINGLTDRFHPCQLLADMLTYAEKRGAIAGRLAAWVGDGNNVCNSLMHASALARMRLSIATPPGLGPDPATLKSARRRVPIRVGTDPQEAVKGADVVMTDTFSSIHDTDAARKKRLLKKYQVNDELMSHARKGAFFMHCLPAKRGEEVTSSVIDGPNSAAWDGVENRLHAQKALLLSVLARGSIS